MILLIKPILLKFATSDSVKKLIVDLLKKLVSTTDNKVDDKAVEFLEKQLFPEKYWLKELRKNSLTSFIGSLRLNSLKE